MVTPLVGTIGCAVETHCLTQSAWNDCQVLGAKLYFGLDGAQLVLDPPIRSLGCRSTLALLSRRFPREYKSEVSSFVYEMF